jgi:1-aminocyclopropane-1-carboxylate deaminase/D-cysteine desulfhydrase
VLSLLQLLKQEGIFPKLFLEKPKNQDRKGNYFFLSLLASQEEIHFVDSAFTPDPSFLWIPLGGCMQEALAGALTLALDIVENEIALQTEFAHVFIDAGTGLSAIALILGFAILGKKTQIHVVLMAGTKQDFLEKLSIYHQYVKKQLQEEIVFPENFRLLFPCTAKSFGSVNGKVLQCIVNTAQKEGILLDPLYSSKLLLTIRETPIQEPTLWVHSGGVLSLTGFQELFKNYTG